jgi:hypothetical protein
VAGVGDVDRLAFNLDVCCVEALAHIAVRAGADSLLSRPVVDRR